MHDTGGRGAENLRDVLMRDVEGGATHCLVGQGQGREAVESPRIGRRVRQGGRQGWCRVFPIQIPVELPRIVVPITILPMGVHLNLVQEVPRDLQFPAWF